MGLIAFALTIIAIAAVAVIYVYFSGQALRRALNDDRPLWPRGRSPGNGRRRRAWMDPVSAQEPASGAGTAAKSSANKSTPAEPVAMSGASKSEG